MVVGVVVAMRVRFVFTPISSDEGGYLAVARAWSRGATLYRQAWVDRPQGLLVLFRVWNAIGLGSPHGVRVLAIIAAIVGAFACGSIARTLGGERAWLPAALISGVLISVPQWEGFIANAELLSGAIGAVGMAMVLAARWSGRTAPWWRLAAAGAVSGFALLTKQSAFDTAGVCLAILAVDALVRRRAGGWSALLSYSCGIVAAVGAAVLHGALTDWERWWFSNVGYRLGQQSVLQSADWAKFRETFGIVWPIVVITLLVAAIVAVVERRRLRWPIALVVGGWLILAAGAFMAGGLFHRHYWVLLMFPIGVGVGLLAALPTRQAVSRAALAAMAVVPLAATINGARLSRDQVGPKLEGDGRLVINEHVADWVRQHRTDRYDAVYAMCASAGLYGNIDSDPPYPYLWFLGVRAIDGATELLAETLRSEDRPRFVAVYQSPNSCDPSGATQAALDANYRRVEVVSRVVMYERTP